jgi:hypothetical protein
LDFDKIKETLSSYQHDLNDGHLYAKIFTLISQRRKTALAKDADNIKRVCAEEYDELSRRLDHSKLQESCSVRNVLKTRRLANLLINDKGELNLPLLLKVIQLTSENLYSFGPERQHDAVRQIHILKMLQLLHDSKDMQRQLKNIGRPHSNKTGDQLILDTLQLPEKTAITDAHARRAVLSALLCYLRQNVGSCFATAPCIVVHDEQPLQFMIDVNELLSTGRLKRTWAGVEYSVPLSPTWGSGDLKRVVPFAKSELWLSPGLLAACDAAGLTNPDQPLQERMEYFKTLWSQLFGNDENKPPLFISPEEVIKTLLLKKHKISEKDLKEYQDRPHGMIQNNIMFQTPHGGGGKGQACANFLIQFEIAKNAFKALTDNALLKSWEFTVACFAENKAGFTNWNLYSSLGLGVQEPGGIGQCLYKFLNKKLEESNLKLQELQAEYEVVYSQIKHMEMRIKHATEKEAAWLRAEYQSKRNEFYTFEELKNKTQMKAQRYANLYNTLAHFYNELFPKYFQEVYDADMHDVSSGPYDDSPAGFRLLYKFGRSNTSSWQRIYTPGQFVDALCSFFSMTETEIAASDQLSGMEEDLSYIITTIINHIKTQEFIETAFHRMAAAHHTRSFKNPLQHLDEIEKKPWSYTSGGSMDTLVTTYFRRDQKPTEQSRWAESPTELNVFLVDIMKQTPKNVWEPFISNEQKSMLMQSPTHAFVFKPGMLLFQDLWRTDAFTYTWVRDNIIIPRDRFVDNISLDSEMLEYLVEQMAGSIPENYRHFFKKNFSQLFAPMKTSEFREHIIDGLQKELGLRSGGKSVLSPDFIDGALFNLLPMFSIGELYEHVEKIFDELKDVFEVDRNLLHEILEAILKGCYGTKVVSSQALQYLCMALLCLFADNTCTPINYHERVCLAAQKLGYAMPKPIIFADTNWVKDYFAFMINPGNGRWELWRVDCLGFRGFPMSDWERWLDGSQRQAKWGVYTRPHEYTF